MAKWIILAIIAFLLIALVSIIVVTVWVQAEAPFRKEKLVRSGRASALILYHPSRDAHFSDDVTMALARGFEEDGFSVERWTITRQTPARPMGFNVIAVVSNTFFWAPDWPTQRYLERADLGDQQVLAILGGGGNTHRAQLALMRDIGKTGAHLVAIKDLWTSRPNGPDVKPGGNREMAMQIARRLARDVGKKVLMVPPSGASSPAGSSRSPTETRRDPVEASQQAQISGLDS